MDSEDAKRALRELQRTLEMLAAKPPIDLVALKKVATAAAEKLEGARAAIQRRDDQAEAAQREAPRKER